MVFDLDETLIEDTADAAYRAAVAHIPGVDVDAVALAAKLAARAAWRESEHFELGRSLGVASWEAMWANFDGGHPSLAGLRNWAPGHRRSVWERVLADCGADLALAGTLEATYIGTHRAGHPELPGAADLVRCLHKSGVSIGVLTNGPPDIQRLKLQQLGMSEYFAARVISGVSGVGKPDRAIFDEVLTEMGATADATVMVGDSWESDIVGATEVGMRAVWVSQGRPPPADLPGVWIVSSTADAAPLFGC